MAGVLRQGFFGPGEARATSISRSGSVRSEQRSLERKGLPPFGLRPVWPVASLLVGHSPTCGGCSLLAPRHRPNWAQQNTSHLGDTTLASLALLRSRKLFRGRRDRFPVHFVIDQFGESNVTGAQIGRGIDQGPAARATGRVELPHALGNEVNQNVGIANFLQCLPAKFCVQVLSQSVKQSPTA